MLQKEYADTLIPSSGDSFIPSPFSTAAANDTFDALLNETYNKLFGLTGEDSYQNLDSTKGALDITMMNIIGFDAATVGNHDLDKREG